MSVITGEANNVLYVPATAVTTTGSTSTVVVVGANNTEQTVPVTLGVQGSTDDQILTGLTLGEKVLTSTATPGTGTGSGGFPFRGGGGSAAGSAGAWAAAVGDDPAAAAAAAAARGPAAGRGGATGRGAAAAGDPAGVGGQDLRHRRGGGARAARGEPGCARAGLRRDHGRVRVRQVDA